MQLVHELARLLAPWQQLFSDSKAVSTAVISAHILALLLGGGLAVSADRKSLMTRASDAEDRSRLVHELERTHSPVLIAIGVLFVSGLALAAADVDSYAVSVLFWVKMGVFAALLLNGALLKRNSTLLGQSERTGSGGSAVFIRRLRLTATLSLGLWCATLVLGTALSSYS